MRGTNGALRTNVACATKPTYISASRKNMLYSFYYIQMKNTDLNKELKRITSIILRKYHPLKIILFGSFSAGQTHQWSDLDLVVIKDTEKRFPERIGELLSLTEPQVPTDFLVYTPKEFEEMAKFNYFIKEEVLKKGKIIYGHPVP